MKNIPFLSIFSQRVSWFHIQREFLGGEREAECEIFCSFKYVTWLASWPAVSPKFGWNHFWASLRSCSFADFIVYSFLLRYLPKQTIIWFTALMFWFNTNSEFKNQAKMKVAETNNFLIASILRIFETPMFFSKRFFSNIKFDWKIRWINVACDRPS